MDAEYNPSSFAVKNFVCLTADNCGCRFSKMNYGERLIKAREHAKLTQAQLSERLGKDADGKDYMSQSNISALERDPKTKGSLHSVKLARACGVTPDWLAYEQGEMVDGLHVDDERIKRGVEMLEQLKAEYRLDDALNFLNSAVKLARKKTEQ